MAYLTQSATPSAYGVCCLKAPSLKQDPEWRRLLQMHKLSARGRLSIMLVALCASLLQAQDRSTIDSANRGDRVAQWKLAKIYQGAGDHKKAARWFELLAK